MSKLMNAFFDNAAKTPDKEAIWCDGKSLSYKELAGMVNRYSNFMLNCGIKYGDHVGIPMNNSLESVALLLSAADLGIALAPINSTLPLEAIYKAFETGGVTHVIARKHFYTQCDKAGGLKVPGVKICIDEPIDGTYWLADASKQSVSRPVTEPVTGDETYILTMTSGSTGAPKPIELTQNNKLERAYAHISLYDITPEDRILAATPLYHSLAERLVLLPLILGATSVLLPRFTPKLWLDCVKEQRVTFTIAVSAQLAQIAKLMEEGEEADISSLRSIVSSSALLDPETRSRLIEKLRCDFHEMYGTSESSTATSINFKESLDKQKSVGRALPEAEIKITDDQENTLPAGQVGEILIKSRLSFAGYYNMPEKMSEAMTDDGFFRTGDLGHMDEDGYLYFDGRKKELIITGGVNVYPQDVDECAAKLPQVKECAAFAYPDERLGEVVALAVVVREDGQLTKREVQRWCAKHLADFQQPQKVYFIDALPRNAMGKLQRNRVWETIQTTIKE